MFELPPNPELLRSLGRLVRGLSALFWGLPAALIICVGTAVSGWFRAFSIAPAVAATGLLLSCHWETLNLELRTLNLESAGSSVSSRFEVQSSTFKVFILHV